MPAIELTRILDYHAGRHDGIAYRLGEDALTWAELGRRAAARAALLARHGVVHDDLVALSLPNGPAFFETAFAIWQCGATPLPLSPRLAEQERRAILELARARVYVAENDCTGSGVPWLAPDAPTGAADFVAAATTSHWKACTSGGSTGRPKIIVDHRPGAFDPEAEFVALPRDGVVLNTAPLYHNGPFSAMAMALFKGSTVIDMARFDAERVLALIEAHRVQWVYMVPTMMHRIWRLGEDVRARYDLSSLQMVFHTAGPIPRWLKQAWIEWLGPARVGEVYGATEGLARIWISGEEWLQRPGAVGRVAGGARVRILDADGRDCATGEVGEVYLMPPGGPGSTYHYIGAESRRTADGWESVGDLGWLDADGYLYLSDRRDDMIVSGGVNVYPAEVEGALLGHPDVASVAVIGLADDEFGHTVHAVVQPRGTAPAAADLKAWLGEHLVPAKIPRSFEFVDHPVRDDAGKVRRSALRAARQG